MSSQYFTTEHYCLFFLRSKLLKLFTISLFCYTVIEVTYAKLYLRHLKHTFYDLNTLMRHNITT